MRKTLLAENISCKVSNLAYLLIMQTGTSHFVSFESARRYYLPYGFKNTAEAVRRKIQDGEITIGPPQIKNGQKLLVIQDEGRYAIQD